MIKPDEVKTVEDMGMPLHKSSYKFGNLFIHFTIQFPDKVTDKQINKVSEALSRSQKPTDIDMSDVEETVKLQEFTEAHKNTHVEGGTQGEDDEDEEDEDMQGGQGQKVRCNQ